jgi:hypothetical protein
VVAASSQPGRPGRLAVLRDSVSKTIYLIDTGAVYSVIPYTSKEPPSGPNITAADGSPIPCWGWQAVKITAGGRTVQWRFLRAAVAFALIGSDFLAHFDLKVDLRRLRLIGCSGDTIPLQEPPRAGVFALYGIRPAPAAAPSPSPSHSLCSTPSALPPSPPSPPRCSSPSALQCGVPLWTIFKD